MYTHTSNAYPRTRQFLGFCGHVLFIAACVGLLTYQFLIAVAHQQEIDTRHTPDACRAQPALCDLRTIAGML